MSIRKYEFTGDKKVLPNGTSVNRIRALRDIPRYHVKEGDLGGWLQFSENLLEENDCWVGDEAVVHGIETVVKDKAFIGDTATLRSTYGAHSILGGDTFVTGKVDILDSVLIGDEITIRSTGTIMNCRFYGKDIIVTGSPSLYGINIMQSAKKVRIYENAVVEGKLLPILIHGESITIRHNARLIDVNRIVGKDFTACDDSFVGKGVTLIGRDIQLSGASSLQGKLQVENNVHLSECAAIFNDTEDILTISLVELDGDVVVHASSFL